MRMCAALSRTAQPGCVWLLPDHIRALGRLELESVLGASAGLTSTLLKLSTERWPKLSRISSAASPAGFSPARKPTRTACNWPSLALGVATTHSQAVLFRRGGQGEIGLQGAQIGRGGNQGGGRRAQRGDCLRAVTWFRSASYSHRVWPSATMLCSNGFL